MERIADWLAKLDNYGISFWVGAIVGFIIILALRAGLQKALKKVTANERTELFLATVINWLTIFIITVYSFSYFSRTGLIYRTLFTFGDTDITIFLIFAVIFSLILAVKLSNAVRQYILPTV